MYAQGDTAMCAAIAMLVAILGAKMCVADGGLLYLRNYPTSYESQYSGYPYLREERYRAKRTIRYK